MAALSAARHGRWSWQPRALALAAGVAGPLPVGLVEATRLAASLPLIFRRGDDGAVAPFCLVRAEGAKVSPMVTDDGRFRGPQPVALATAPFLIAGTSASGAGKAHLWLDEASPLVLRGPGGVPFFDAEGLPSASVRKVASALAACAQDRRAGGDAAAALDRAGVLRSLVHPAVGPGFLSADAEALDALAGERLAVLQAAGALRLAWAQRVSLAHLTVLAFHAANPRAQGVTAFLAAMAEDGDGLGAADAAF